MMMMLVVLVCFTGDILPHPPNLLPGTANLLPPGANLLPGTANLLSPGANLRKCVLEHARLSPRVCAPSPHEDTNTNDDAPTYSAILR